MKYKCSEYVNLDFAKKLIDEGMELLDNNDLGGFYLQVLHSVKERNTTGAIVGAVICILEECGIDTANEFVRVSGTIPESYAQSVEPGWMIKNGELIFPPDTKKIGRMAFASAEGFDSIDFGQVEEIFPTSFFRCSASCIKVGKALASKIADMTAEELDEIFGSTIERVDIPAQCKPDEDIYQMLFNKLARYNGDSDIDVEIRFY